MNHVVLMTLLQHLLSLFLSIFGIKMSSVIIFNKKLFNQSIKFSPVISLYFIFLFIQSSIAAIDYFFLVIFWRPEENIYNPKLLYWFGFFPFILGYLEIVLEILLCADRCLITVFPLQYTSQYRMYFSIFTCFGIFASAGGFLLVNAVLSVIPASARTTCITFGCLLTNSPTQNLFATKLSLAGTNFCAGIILSFLIKFSFKKHRINNRGISKTLVIIICSTVFFEISPSIISIIVLNITGRYLNELVGPYAVTFSALNMALCAVLYTTACRKAFNYAPTRTFAVQSIHHIQTPISD